LSFSWSAFFGRTPERVRFRLVGVATARLPTPACVNRTCRALHPIGHVWLWSESRRGICDAPCSPLTRFESNGSADFHVRVFPARPHSRTHQVHEIESEDYSRLVTGDYFQKPLSNVASHSRGTTLYGT
jgi:hypothetical protein